jgi:hypothetical protein
VTSSSPAASEPERFYFLHLQKTAGTALWRRLKQQFPPDAVYPGPSDGEPPDSVMSVEHLLERWHVRRDDIRIVTGHFPLCTTELLDAPFTTLTVLRDPVERTLSYLRHHREATPADRDRPLEEIYEDPIRFELVHNHMVKMLSLSSAEMTNGMLTPVTFGPERLERARRRLDGLDVVGFQEQFDEFCAELSARFGWSLGPPIFMNRSAPVAIDDALRARIEADNRDDVELYEHARQTRGATRRPARLTPST